MAAELAAGHLLTVKGFGHTELLNPSRCAQEHVAAYLIDGKLPSDGTQCVQDRPAVREGLRLFVLRRSHRDTSPSSVPQRAHHPPRTDSCGHVSTMYTRNRAQSRRSRHVRSVESVIGSALPSARAVRGMSASHTGR